MFITINQTLFNFLLAVAASHITLLVIIKIFELLIHIRNNCKIIIIEFFYEKFLVQHKFPYCIARSQMSFYFPQSNKFS